MSVLCCVAVPGNLQPRQQVQLKLPASSNSSRFSSSSSSSSSSRHSVFCAPPKAALSSSSSRCGFSRSLQHSSGFSIPLQQQHRHKTSAAAAAADGSSGGQAAAVAEDPLVEPFSESDLRALTDDESSLDQEALAEAWRENFEGDVDGLYDYVDRWGGGRVGGGGLLWGIPAET